MFINKVYNFFLDFASKKLPRFNRIRNFIINDLKSRYWIRTWTSYLVLREFVFSLDFLFHYFYFHFQGNVVMANRIWVCGMSLHWFYVWYAGNGTGYTGCSERRLIGHSFYRRNFLRKSCATCREKCRRAASRPDKSDKPVQWTPCILEEKNAAARHHLLSLHNEHRILYIH
jgi:hypothetical protein